MLRYIIKRILQSLLVVFGVVLFVFVISRLCGDPIPTLLGDGYTQEQYDAMKIQLGLDKPVVIQFFNYIKGIVLHFDLGTSYSTKLAVRDEVLSRFPISMRIALISLIVSVPIGVFIGITSAIKQYSTYDNILTTFTVFLLSMPNFWVALMLMMLLALQLNWVPAAGIATWKGYILPCMTLALHPITHNARLSRTTMLEVIRQDYIRTARSKGLTEKEVILNHALQNAGVPIVTQIGSNFAILVGGASIIERIFNIPGVGSYIVFGITSRDYPAVQGGVLVFCLFVCLVNLIVDLCYGFIDPRIKAKYTGVNKGKGRFGKNIKRTGGTEA